MCVRVPQLLRGHTHTNKHTNTIIHIGERLCAQKGNIHNMYVCMYVCVCVYLCMFVSVCRTMTQRACIQMPNNIIHVRCNTVQCSTIPHHTTQHLTEVPNTTRNISQCNTDTVAIAKASANTNTTRCKTIQVQRQM